MNIRFGPWNVKVEALSSVTSKIENHGMDQVGVQEIKWGGNDTLESGN